MTQKMLEGFKVIDFTHVVAGPHATKILAEHGAEVIKIESVGGELARLLPTQREGRSAYFIQHNVGKKTMAMDISTKEAQDICYELIKHADGVVENFAPGVMKKHNLDWETLRKINPELIMCSISCFGQTGPLSTLPGFDWIGQSYAGIIDLHGEPGQKPVFGDIAMGDVSTGAHAYGAIVTALLHKSRGGKGQYIDISLMEVMFSYHEMSVQLYNTSGGQILASRSGSHHGMLAPVGIFKCKDRYIFLLAVNHQWEKLTTAMGREDMFKDPRFSDIASLAQHKDEINAAVEEWMDSIGDPDKVLEILQANRVPSAPILNIAEVMEHPHSKERGLVRTVTDPIFGEVGIPRTPFRFSEFPDTPELQTGTLGQYNHEILSEELGYSDQQISELEAKGIIGSKNI
jgi:crotonobetainyl-CoA:carnitine CoA-transferase CaiB-like acyl-CoA transferase